MTTADTTSTVPQPSTAQLVTAIGAALLPFAGPAGVAVAAVLPALEQVYASIKGSGKTDYTVEDFAAIVAEGNAELAKAREIVGALDSKKA